VPHLLRNEEGEIQYRTFVKYLSPSTSRIRLKVEFAEVDERLVCVNVQLGTDLEEFDVFNDPDGPSPEPLTTAMWRQVNLSTEIAEALQGMARFTDNAALAARAAARFGHDEAATKAAYEQLGSTAERTLEMTKQVGRPPLYDDDHYRDVARVYEANRSGGKPRKAVADHFSVSLSQAAKWVSTARTKEYIVDA
jgi:hypothetical protein